MLRFSDVEKEWITMIITIKSISALISYADAFLVRFPNVQIKSPGHITLYFYVVHRFHCYLHSKHVYISILTLYESNFPFSLTNVILTIGKWRKQVPLAHAQWGAWCQTKNKRPNGPNLNLATCRIGASSVQIFVPLQAVVFQIQIKIAKRLPTHWMPWEYLNHSLSKVPCIQYK